MRGAAAKICFASLKSNMVTDHGYGHVHISVDKDIERIQKLGTMKLLHIVLGVHRLSSPQAHRAR
jgi:hypothetical protein